MTSSEGRIESDLGLTSEPVLFSLELLSVAHRLFRRRQLWICSILCEVVARLVELVVEIAE
jgi:hypothetical protein